MREAGIFDRDIGKLFGKRVDRTRRILADIPVCFDHMIHGHAGAREVLQAPRPVGLLSAVADLVAIQTDRLFDGGGPMLEQRLMVDPFDLA